MPATTYQPRPPRDHTRLVTFLSACIVLGLMLVFANGGCAASSKQRTLSGMLIAVDTARIGFVTWDDDHQQQLVEEAESYEAGVQALAEYREKRMPVLLAFELAYQGIARAALEDDQEVLTNAQSAVDNLKELLLALLARQLE